MVDGVSSVSSEVSIAQAELSAKESEQKKSVEEELVKEAADTTTTQANKPTGQKIDVVG